MNKKELEQIDKVLALADSDQEGEALGALRMARRLLEKEGLSFSSLVQAARRGRLGYLGGSVFSATQSGLESQIDQLQDEIDAHVEQNASLTSQIDTWRRRSFELEQLLGQTKAEADRWRHTARETAERLWDLGQIARADVFHSDSPVPEDADDEQDLEQEPLKAAG